MVSAARRRIVYKSIESAIKKGQEVEYWAMRMYEQEESGVLTSEQVAALEALIEAYYEAQEAAAAAAEQSVEESVEVEDEPHDDIADGGAE